MATKKKAKKKAAAKKKGAQQGQGRKSEFSGLAITKLVAENPRREGSIGHKSFSLIKNGMTYEQYISAGGRRSDLAFDKSKGYVKLSKAS